MAARTRSSARGKSSRPVDRSIDWIALGRVVAASLFGFGALAGLALAFPEGAVTAPLQAGLRRAFGWTAPIFPLWLAAVGGMLLHRVSGADWPLPRLRIAGLALLSLSIVALAHTLPADGLSAAERAADGLGGGLAGLALSQQAAQAFGHSGAFAAWMLLVLVGGWLLLQPRSSHLRAAVALGRACLAAMRRLSAVVRQGLELVRPLLARLTRRRSGPPPIAVETLVEPTPVPTAAPDASPRWELPSLSLFVPGKTAMPSAADLRLRAQVIEETLASFNIEARVVEINPGPTVTQFGLEPAMGVAVNRVLARGNDLALRLGASPLRFEAPVPGKRVVGVEIPNGTVATVSIRELFESQEFLKINSRLRLALGRDVSGAPVVGDLARMPHLLIAGATGSGKSVCINVIVASLLMQSTPDELQLLMIDPKMVELSGYAGIPHLRMPVVTEMDRVVGTLKWAVKEMERRYALLSSRACRNIDAFNKMALERGEARLPFLVLIIDELADMMMTAADEVERALCRLAQLGRAAGIHLVVATQRPSVDVLTGLIKANFITRIAFAVSSQVDSRVILDMAGAEKLLGRGDMLYTPADANKPIRLQGAYVSDAEIQALVSYWSQLGKPAYDERDVQELIALGRGDDEEDDELYARAEELAGLYTRLSVSLLQRRLGIGYPRAARLLDLLEERGALRGRATREEDSRAGTGAELE